MVATVAGRRRYPKVRYKQPEVRQLPKDSATAPAAYPGTPITRAEYERMIHEMIVAVAPPRRTILEV